MPQVRHRFAEGKPHKTLICRKKGMVIKMFKALLKKQFSEMLALMFRANSNKRGNSGSTAGFIVLLVFLVGVMAAMFLMLTAVICGPLVEAGLGWLYFAMVAGISTVLGIFGSVFSTYSGIYEAKDNELLLSMPIKPGMILVVRMLSIYVLSLIFEAVVLVPAGISYLIFGSPKLIWFVLYPLMVLILPLLALAVSCILGWLLAMIIPKIGSKSVKSIITMVISVAFFIAYFIFYSKLNTMMQYIITNSESIGQSIKGGMYPLYCLGRAAEGDIISFSVILAAVILIFAVIYALLSHNFIKIAVGRRSVFKAKYVRKPLKEGNADSALLAKEFSHYFSSTAYMLNCSLGSVLLIIAAVALIIKGGALMEMFSGIGEIDSGIISLIFCAVIAFIISTNALTAPSISLEGKTLWLLQSLPVNGKKVLMSKIKLHMILTAPAALLCSLAAVIILKPEPIEAIMVLLFSVIFTLFCAVSGLLVNLFMPKLDWTSETVAVKQSMSVFVSLMLDYAVIIILGVIYFIIGSFVSAGIFLLLSVLFLTLLSIVIFRLLFTKGVKILAEL